MYAFAEHGLSVPGAMPGRCVRSDSSSMQYFCHVLYYRNMFRGWTRDSLEATPCGFKPQTKYLGAPQGRLMRPRVFRAVAGRPGQRRDKIHWR